MTIEYELESEAGEVFVLLTDADFLSDRLVALGEDPPEVAVKKKGKGVEISLRRVKHLDLPAVAAKIVGGEQRFAMTETWQPSEDGWVGEFLIDVIGAPASIAAEMELYPSEAGCIYRITHKPRVKVPLVGKKLEQILMKETEKGCDEEIDYLVDALG